MRRLLFTLGAIFLGLYLAAHIALGSSPVQRWVLGKIRATLDNYGVQLSIESIEFSALSPKLYLNRVKISTTKKAPLRLAEPLSIDKIKLHFQPLALISRQIVIEEVTLFHPQVIVPRADRLYRRVEQLLRSTKGIEIEGEGSFNLLVKKAGFVDALFNVESRDPAFAVRSRSLSAFVAHSATGQKNISVQSNSIEIDRGPLSLNLSQLDLSVDLTRDSVRLNRALVVGKDMKVDIKGTSSLPVSLKNRDTTLRLSVDLDLPLDVLNRIPETEVAGLSGSVQMEGSLNLIQRQFSGKGAVGYRQLAFDEYKIGTGTMDYDLEQDQLALTRFNVQFGGGTIRSPLLKLSLTDRYPLEGELNLSGLTIERILGDINEESPVRMDVDGKMKVTGFLSGPFDLQGDMDSQIGRLVVLDETKGTREATPSILDFKDGTLLGKLFFTEDRFSWDSALNILDGEGSTRGHVGFGGAGAQVTARMKGVSLDKLGSISGLQIGGTGDLVAEVDVQGGEPRIAGTFDLLGASFVDLKLGDTKGQAYYQNQLLSFENLELPGLEPIRGSGFVDFRPEEVHYKFNVDIQRALMNRIFSVFPEDSLTFHHPTDGEANSRVSIEGGHDEGGVEVVASGRAKAFQWYDEKWRSSDFIFTYRDDLVELNRVMLLKESGGIEVKGFFKDDKSRLSFTSHDLRIDDLNFFRGAPLSARLEGEVTLEGNGEEIMRTGSGELRLLNTTFRGKPFADSVIQARPVDGGIEFLGSIFGDTAKGRYVRGKMKDELMLVFRKFDLAPLVSTAMNKDLPALLSMNASGDVSLKGDFTKWDTLEGSGQFLELELGLRGNPMRNTNPVNLSMSKGNIEVGRFQLLGTDGEVSGDLILWQGEKVESSLDGKLDLQYLHPFIPGLEYGAGKTTVALRISGKPSRYRMLGNVVLEDGTLRLTGLEDEFRNSDLQISVSHEQLNVDKFEAKVNGGKLLVSGAVGIDRFSKLAPNLKIITDRVGLRFQDYLETRLSGQFTLTGEQAPYLMKGECSLVSGKLTKFAAEASPPTNETPSLKFDIACAAKDGFRVETDVMNADFGGRFNVLGNTQNLGLVGRAEANSGYLFFRETRFDLESATVRFESPNSIRPRFRVAGRALVKEQKAIAPEEYQVNLQVIGVPEDYKIRLTSSPALTENDLISLLVLGVTSSSQGQGEGNYVDLGTTIVGQMPLQSKLQDELGVDIKIKTQSQQVDQLQQTTTSAGATSGDITVPAVQIQKEITDKTKVSFSNTLEAIPVREFRIEQILDENLTVNATAGSGNRGNTAQPVQTYGLDFRFRFEFD